MILGQTPGISFAAAHVTDLSRSAKEKTMDQGIRDVMTPNPVSYFPARPSWTLPSSCEGTILAT